MSAAVRPAGAAGSTSVSVLVVHEGGDPLHLRATLDALSDPDMLASAEIVVVDDASREPHRPDVRSRRGLQMLVNETPVGLAAAVNRAAAAARGVYLLLLRPGVEASWSAVRTLVSALESDGRLAAVAPAVRCAEGGTVVCPARSFTTARSGIAPMVRRRHEAAAPADVASPRTVDWAGDSALLVRASVFRALCGLDEGFGRYGAEEDWCWRVRQRGYRVGVVAGACVRDRQLAARSERVWTTAAGHRSALRLIARRSGPLSVLGYRVTMSFALLVRALVTGLTGRRRRGARTRMLVRCLWSAPAETWSVHA